VEIQVTAIVKQISSLEVYGNTKGTYICPFGQWERDTYPSIRAMDLQHCFFSEREVEVSNRQT
jgi:hypothetical protein